jgi:hypothetical protein
VRQRQLQRDRSHFRNGHHDRVDDIDHYPTDDVDYYNDHQHVEHHIDVVHHHVDGAGNVAQPGEPAG